MMRSKYVKHAKGGKQRLTNMKYFVKQVIRAAGISNRYDLVVQKWSPRKVMDLYLGLGIYLIFLAGPVIKVDTVKQYHGRHISMCCINGRVNYLGRSDGMSRAGGVGLVHQ